MTWLVLDLSMKLKGLGTQPSLILSIRHPFFKICLQAPDFSDYRRGGGGWGDRRVILGGSEYSCYQPKDLSKINLILPTPSTFCNLSTIQHYGAQRAPNATNRSRHISTLDLHYRNPYASCPKCPAKMAYAMHITITEGVQIQIP